MKENHLVCCLGLYLRRTMHLTQTFYQEKKKKLLPTTFKNGKREKKNDHKKTDLRIVISDGSSKVI
ncbi:hypothetical protein SKUD_146503 [Saccharomyces kudriavzevii IFO 1802]|uniref:Uncharacterized protein n=1 Tax=Saccharomyces kudriavzevii (strain ATCC MYA-4449 / AS 2.2408 / CBS 8840 / NBRC 1802 / NCYC 2889) TaxID=226230 RepID=J4TUV5_SACK1|nr:hypothetical protein SKUD_146503 [Saccharomyces kudriavzevii IFO 1802]